MRDWSDRFIPLVRWLAGALAVIVTVSIPAIYSSASYRSLVASMETEVEINSRIATQLINESPETWVFQQHRLEELLSRRPSRGIKETRRILDPQGRVIVEISQDLASLTLTRSGNLLDSGRVAGYFQISRSLRPWLVDTGLVFLLSSLLGAAIYGGLLYLPIRALHTALESLARERERAQVTLRSIQDGVIATDTTGRVTLINEAAEKLTGCPQADALTKPVGEILRLVNERTKEKCEDPFQRIQKPGSQGWPGEAAKLLSKDGTERAIVHSGAPIHDPPLHGIGVVMVLHDITEWKNAEEQLLRMQHLQSIGVLAGGIAHDFNNLLTGIFGNLDLALACLDSSHPAHPWLKEAEKACTRATGLTKQLLTFAKGGAPVKKTVAIGKLVREAVGFSLSGSNVSCELTIPEDLQAADVDVGQFHQLVQNLILNAKEAMPSGGRVWVAGENVEIGPGSSPGLKPGRYVKISVRDQGVGIDPVLIEKIFEPYFTRKKKGHGLGLATVYSIVKRHDGHVAVESELGVGTTFHVYLPASKRTPELEESTGKQPVPGTGRILVMDDDESVKRVAESILRASGYEVEFAGGGEEAIELYLVHKKAGNPFDAVIMDLTIPGGMGGKEAIAKLREIDPGIRAIVSSGYSDDPVMADPERYGFQAVLSKPFRMQELNEALHAALGESAE